MDRRTIERTTASLAVILLFICTVGVILFAADQFFAWDIFPPGVETILGFTLVSCVMIVVSSVLVNVMLNLSLMAINSDILVEKLTRHEKHT